MTDPNIPSPGSPEEELYFASQLSDVADTLKHDWVNGEGHPRVDRSDDVPVELRELGPGEIPLGHIALQGDFPDPADS